MGSLLRAPSPAMRLWRAAVRLASSVGVAGGALLQAVRQIIKVRAVMAKKARGVERLLVAYIGPLFLWRILLLRTL
jgi:hypothetical protein